MSTPCLYCRFLGGCELLVDSDGIFMSHAVLLEDDTRECERWTPVDVRNQGLRMALFDLTGIQSVQAIRESPGAVATVKEDEEVSMPDFHGMLGNGVTYREREKQLTYVTDEAGNLLLDEEGKPRPRSILELKKYAESLGVDQRVALFWKLKPLRDWILQEEKEQGLILNPQQKKKLEAAQPAQPKKEASMPRVAGRGSVRVNRGAGPVAAAASGTTPAKAAAAAAADDGNGEDKVATPATNKPKPASRGRGKARTAKPKAAAAPPAEAPAEAPAPAGELVVDLGPVMEAIEGLRADVAALSAKVDNCVTAEGVRAEQDNLYTDMVRAITVLHDVMAPQLFPDEEGNADETRTLLDKDMTIVDLVDDTPAEGN